MEILQPQQYGEYEAFAGAHRNGNFMQSRHWAELKSNWEHRVVVSRGADGNIRGAASVLIQKIPVLGFSFLYTPRGPVYDYDDIDTLKDLLAGIKLLARQHRGFLFKMDPGVRETERGLIERYRALGFRHRENAGDFETMQTRYNYGLTDIAGKTEEQVLMSFSQKTRYNIRLAIKHGVECRVVGKEYMPEFMRLMRVTALRDCFVCRSQDYYERMLEVFGENMRLYMCFYEGKAVSAALCCRYAGKTSYVFGASDNEHRNVMPNYLMQWEMIRWAIEGGCFLYDFLGVPVGVPEDNPMIGVYRFKKGFNGEILALAGEFDLPLNLPVYRAFLLSQKIKRRRAQREIDRQRDKNAEKAGAAEK